MILTSITDEVSKHLIALNQRENNSDVKRALKDWYSVKQRSYKDWAEKYPIRIIETETDHLAKHTIWYEVANIKATPTLFINEYLLPEMYQINDIKYLLLQ